MVGEWQVSEGRVFGLLARPRPPVEAGGERHRHAVVYTYTSAADVPSALSAGSAAGLHMERSNSAQTTTYMWDANQRRTMTQAGPLRWRTGAGWLVLAGGGDWREGDTGAVDAAALGWADLDRPMAVLLTAGGLTAEGEALLEYYTDLGGPSGVVVPIFDAAGAQRVENYQLLAEAGLIYIGDGLDALGLVQALHGSPALEALGQAFDNGATVVGMGAGAMVLGAWVAAGGDPRQAEPGWGWLPTIVVETHFTGTKAAHQLRELLNAHPDCLGLGIPDGVALALGPDGRVETIGEGKVTVVLSEAGNEPEK
jgi:cyanophycinase